MKLKKDKRLDEGLGACSSSLGRVKVDGIPCDVRGRFSVGGGTARCKGDNWVKSGDEVIRDSEPTCTLMVGIPSLLGDLCSVGLSSVETEGPARGDDRVGLHEAI